MVLWLWVTTQVGEDVGSNPEAVHWMDIFTLICCKNCNDDCLERPKINEKEAGVTHLQNNDDYIQNLHLHENIK